jgi:hypothetical protein
MILISVKDGKEMQNINLQKSVVSNFNVAEINNFILITLSDGSVKLVNAGGQIYEILMPDAVPASSISVIHSDKIVLSKLDGKLLLYKIRKP